MHTLHSNRTWRLLSATSLVVLFGFSSIALLGQLHWLADLLSHFRLHYTLGFVVLVAIFALSRRPVYISLATVGLALSIVPLLPYYFQPLAVATNQPTSRKMSVLFSNINYGNTDHTRLLELVARKKPDVLAIAEALPPEQEYLAQALEREYPFQFVAAGRNQMGIAVYSQHPFLESPQVYYWADSRHPVVAVQIGQTTKDAITVLIMHPPPPLTPKYSAIRNDIFAGISEYAQRVKAPLVVVGDFNSTSWSPHFQAMLTNGRLLDSRTDKGLQTSWPTQLPSFLRISIDHILTNQAVTVMERKVLSDVGSDHLPIWATLAW